VGTGQWPTQGVAAPVSLPVGRLYRSTSSSTATERATATQCSLTVTNLLADICATADRDRRAMKVGHDEMIGLSNVFAHRHAVCYGDIALKQILVLYGSFLSAIR